MLTVALTALCASGAFPQGKPIPYTSQLCGDDDWQVINVVDGTSAWVDDDDPYDFSDTGFDCGKYYKYDRRNAADDWLISPAISLEAGKEYKLSFWLEAGSNENLEVRMAKASDVASLSADGTQVFDYVFDNNWDFMRHSVVITAAEAGDWYFGIHAYSPEDQSKIYLTGFQISENVFMPGAPTGLTVTPDVNGAVSAEVSWTLPVKDSDGAPLPEGAVFDSVQLFRDGTQIRTLPGDAVSFTDTEAEGLTAGKHLYGVSVTVNGVTGPMAELTSRLIGPVSTYALPWTAGVASLDDDEFATLYTILKGEGSQLSSSKGWSLRSGYIRFYPSKYDAQDDWLVLPKVKFEKAGIYRLKVNAEFSNSSPVLLEVYRGDARTIESMTVKLGAFTTLPQSRTDTDVTFEVSEPGEFHLALRAADPEPEYSTYIKLHELTIEEGQLLPEPVSGLTAEIEEDAVRLRWTAPARYNTGREIEKIDRIDIMRDGTLLTSITEGVVPGAAMDYLDGPGLSGIHTYSLIPYIGDLTPKDEPVAVTTPWVGDRTQTLPYTLDFEDASVSVFASLWTIRNNDGDSYMWEQSSDGFVLGVDDWDGGSHDDMLVTPPFHLADGKYELTLNISGGESGLQMLAGVVEDGDETYTMQGAQPVTLDGSKTVSTHTVELSVPAVAPASDRAMAPASGKYSFAIHANAEYGYNARQIKLTSFKAISNGVHSGIDGNMAAGEFRDTHYYDLTGRRVLSPAEGICIRVNADGSRDKVILTK